MPRWWPSLHRDPAARCRTVPCEECLWKEGKDKLLQQVFGGQKIKPLIPSLPHFENLCDSVFLCSYAVVLSEELKISYSPHRPLCPPSSVPPTLLGDSMLLQARIGQIIGDECEHPSKAWHLPRAGLYITDS